MKRVTLFQAVWIDKDGTFRVNGSVAKTEAETIKLCRNHVAIKSGAKLHCIDSWQEWID